MSRRPSTGRIVLALLFAAALVAIVLTPTETWIRLYATATGALPEAG